MVRVDVSSNIDDELFVNMEVAGISYSDENVCEIPGNMVGDNDGNTVLVTSDEGGNDTALAISA